MIGQCPDCDGPILVTGTCHTPDCPQQKLPVGPAAPRGLNDPETAEYPVLVRAYLAIETALAKRILGDQQREQRAAGERPRDDWEHLGQTSHEWLWSRAREEAGLPVEASFKNDVILRGPAAPAPLDPSEAEIKAAWDSIEKALDVGGTPDTQIRLLTHDEVRNALRAAARARGGDSK
jgi:hypothetical protein